VLIWFAAGWSTPCYQLKATLPHIKTFPLISAYAIPDEAIYLYVQTPLGPRGCYLPWSNEQSNKMDKNERDGKKSELNVGEFFAGEPNIQEIPIKPEPPKENSND
jgi:hypothetical protein